MPRKSSGKPKLATTQAVLDEAAREADFAPGAMALDVEALDIAPDAVVAELEAKANALDAEALPAEFAPPAPEVETESALADLGALKLEREHGAARDAETHERPSTGEPGEMRAEVEALSQPEDDAHAASPEAKDEFEAEDVTGREPIEATLSLDQLGAEATAAEALDIEAAEAPDVSAEEDAPGPDAGGAASFEPLEADLSLEDLGADASNLAAVAADGEAGVAPEMAPLELDAFEPAAPLDVAAGLEPPGPDAEGGAGESALLPLPATLTTDAAASLIDDLRARRGAALRIDASGVDVLGGACLQALLSAAAAWRDAGAPLSVIGASEAFRADAARLGAGNLIALIEEADA